jgi:FlaA1/EpsC-like NDP-sugar epimerase
MGDDVARQVWGTVLPARWRECIRDFRLILWPLLGVMSATAYAGAFVLRHGLPAQGWLPGFRHTLPWAVGLELGAFALLGLHRALWRYAGMRDLLKGASAVALGSLLLAGYCAATRQLGEAQAAVIVIDFLLSLVALWSGRASLRLVRELRRGTGGAQHRRLVVVGAGDAGEMAVRELHRNPDAPWRAVAFVDDDLRKRGRRIHGIPVRGTLDDLPAVVQRTQADAVLVAICSAREHELIAILEKARATGLPVKHVPSLRDLISGRAPIHQLQDVTAKDLLRRKAVRLDLTPVRRQLGGKTVLVTGAAGSIGSELCRQIQACAPRRLVLLDRSETGLFELEHELAVAGTRVPCVPLLASVQDEGKLAEVFRVHRPQVVFHAAAYKHVPVLEYFPEEAVRNNVLGTQLVAALARRFGVESFVFISTDKAVHPTSVMGASKRIAELVVADLAAGSSTRFSTIRFGNVLGSNGSVVQLFQRQIARGGPVTVTHPDVRRYFMSIPEAVELVLSAAAIQDDDGGTFILEMGEQVRIVDLACHLIRLCGMRPYADIPIVFTGLRPGEKLYEELWTDQESPVPTARPGILRSARAGPLPAALRQRIDELVACAQRLDRHGVMELVRQLVPEYDGEPVGTGFAQRAAAEGARAEAGRTRTVSPKPVLAAATTAPVTDPLVTHPPELAEVSV